MSEPRNFAPLSPALLARKGGAKPAMRPPMQAESLAESAPVAAGEDDLGWNDMGEVPEVVRQREEIEARLSPELSPELSTAEARGCELPGLRRAAFTLRLDADRHFRLRLASTVLNQSAQVVVTEALDRYLAAVPEVSELAGKVRRRRR